ncbi:hypothetical protein EV2_008287 [Malus domestica]
MIGSIRINLVIPVSTSKATDAPSKTFHVNCDTAKSMVLNSTNKKKPSLLKDCCEVAKASRLTKLNEVEKTNGVKQSSKVRVMRLHAHT